MRKADDHRERIRILADELDLPIAALAGDVQLETRTMAGVELPYKPFDAQAQEYCDPNVIATKLAIADELAKSLAALPPADRTYIDDVLTETLIRRIVLIRIRDHFRPDQRSQTNATRNGYRLKDIVEQFDANPLKSKRFLTIRSILHAPQLYRKKCSGLVFPSEDGLLAYNVGSVATNLGPCIAPDIINVGRNRP